MTLDRRDKRTSRTSKFDVEHLGERIAPAHFGVMSIAGHVHLNLITQTQHKHHGIAVWEIVNPVLNTFKLPVHKPGNPTFPIILMPFSNNAGSNITIRVPAPAPVVPVDSPPPVTFTANPPPTIPVDSPPPVTFTANPPPTPPTPTPAPAPTGPANLSAALFALYEQYESDPAAFTSSTPSTAGQFDIVNGSVNVSVRDSNAAEFQSLTTELANAGMTNAASSASLGMVVGLLPISELVSVAQFSGTVSVTPETSYLS